MEDKNKNIMGLLPSAHVRQTRACGSRLQWVKHCPRWSFVADGDGCGMLSIKCALRVSFLIDLCQRAPVTLHRIVGELVCSKFAVVVERDEDGYYVASVPELPGCQTQAKTLDELTERIKEAMEACWEAEGHRPREGVEHVGFQFVEVSAE